MAISAHFFFVFVFVIQSFSIFRVVAVAQGYENVYALCLRRKSRLWSIP